MSKYTIKDFQIGDSVYHLSNTSLTMVVIEINEGSNEVTCRWLDKAGKKNIEEFLPQELGKSGDRRIRMTAL